MYKKWKVEVLPWKIEEKSTPLNEKDKEIIHFRSYAHYHLIWPIETVKTKYEQFRVKITRFECVAGVVFENMPASIFLPVIVLKIMYH